MMKFSPQVLVVTQQRTVTNHLHHNIKDEERDVINHEEVRCDPHTNLPELAISQQRPGSYLAFNMTLLMRSERASRAVRFTASNAKKSEENSDIKRTVDAQAYFMLIYQIIPNSKLLPNRKWKIKERQKEPWVHPGLLYGGVRWGGGQIPPILDGGGD